MKQSFFLMLLVPFLWGLNFIFGKILIATLPLFTIATGRFTVAGLLFMVWIFITKKKVLLYNTRFYLSLLAISLSGVVVFNISRPLPQPEGGRNYETG